MSTLVKTILWLNMAAVTVLAVVYAHLMISPGHLIDGHKELETDCFACHTLFTGAADGKCVACHKIKDIGLRTSKGAPVLKKAGKTPVAFHQKLTGQECVACHSDHAGVSVYRSKFKFSHDLLDASIRKDCVACHAKPKDNLHKSASSTCTQCHTIKAWKPATFKHELLAQAELAQCVNCHAPVTPKDKLHDTATKKCGVCHVTDKWKPLDFKHDKLNRTDLAKCAACHTAHTPKDKTHSALAPQMLAKCGTCHTTDKWKPAAFKHSLLAKADLEQCISCHKAKTPEDKTHTVLAPHMLAKCGLCHTTDKWKPATFKHATLPKAELEQCVNCHKAKTPKDKIHDNASEKCGLCHKTDKWKPATFKHDLLPRAELRQCATCHLRKKPRDSDHRGVSDRCGNCHYTDRWEPAKKRGVTRSGSSSSGGGRLPSLGGEWWLGGDDD